MVMRMRRFFALHPRLFDATMVIWVAIVTVASAYTILNWE